MIYDCFPFHNELDVLDIRLHELSPVVDRFVIVEATRTHQGAPKPLYFDENKALFKEFASKINHVVIDFPQQIDNRFGRRRNQIWAREYHQRDQIGLGLGTATADDLIIVSDMDEIIRATTLRNALKARPKFSLTIFDVPVYEFYVNRRAKRNPGWLRSCPRMIEFSHFSSAQKLRMTKPFTSKRMRGTWLNRMHTKLYNGIICGIWDPLFIVEDAGWHFSSMGGWNRYRHKLSSNAHVDHMEFPMFKSEVAFANNIVESTTPVDGAELPEFVKKNPDRYPLFAG